MTKWPRPKEFKDPLYMPPDAVLNALGRVAAVSAGIEEQLHALYWKLLGVGDDAGKVIAGDMRSNRMTEDILKLARAQKYAAEKIDDLVDLFATFVRRTKSAIKCSIGSGTNKGWKRRPTSRSRK
jgi:hypothetical protein